jgi:high affinity Mn2+ porin
LQRRSASYKLGSAYPYARVQRAFVRQTINLGGAVEKYDEDVNQFAGTRTADRLVPTVGRFGVNDIFDTNKFANNPKIDFLNWTAINAGTFDYAGDGWGYSYGAAAEWYTGRWTLRGGVFDLSTTPAGGVSPLGYASWASLTVFLPNTSRFSIPEVWAFSSVMAS